MRLLLNTAPTAEPVTLAEAKLHCHEDDVAQDSWFTSFAIPSARENAEHVGGRALMPQTWDVLLDYFPADGVINLPKPPVSAITFVKYYDAAGTLQTLAGTEYALDASGVRARVLLGAGKSWPSVLVQPNAVQIRIVCGYATAAAIPATTKHWMLLNIEYWFKNRELVTRMPGIDGLLNPHQTEWL